MNHRRFFVCLSACLLAATLFGAPALAQTKPAPAPAAAAPAATPAGPKRFPGNFEDWAAATYVEGGQTVCYAFTKAKKSDPAKLPGRGEAVLTVTQRSAGRDAVAFSAGFDYAANATAEVQIDARKDEFYTAKRSAFARDGKAVVAALLKAKTIIVTSPHPNPKTPKVTDTFGPRGFAKAYEAINKACPPK